MDKRIGSCCLGLIVKDTSAPVPLKGVHYDVDVSGFASCIIINQTYRNEETNDLECVYGFPINDQAGIIGFTVKIDDRTLMSQFKKKDEAFKEYSDALSRGDGAYLLDQSDRSDDTFILSVGRLPPGKECTVSISYVCTLESVSEIKMRLTIPMSLSPRYNPSPSTITAGVVPPEKYQTTVPYLATLKGTIEAVNDIRSVTSPTHPLAMTLVGPKLVSVEFGASQQPLDRDLLIEIEVKNNPQYHATVKMLQPNKFVAMYSFVPQLEKESGKINTELIFLVDCSGSMQSEGKIDEAKRALQVFLRSIPEGCYFNFYRFGSTFESLFPTSEFYSAESFAKGKDYVNNTSANLGGTEILKPLEKIFADAPREGFSRQLFVLTDGDVTNTEAVIELVRRNAYSTRVFSFGLGQSPSRSLVNGIALAGNGKSEFIKQGEVLEDKIGRHLARALQPAITNASVTWTGVRNVQQVPTVLPPVFKGDRQLLYAFFDYDNVTDKTEPTVVLKMGDSSSGLSLQIPTSTDRRAEQPFLAKLAARALIKQLEYSPDSHITATASSGSLQRRHQQKVEQPPTAEINANETRITEISLEYGILSKFVSLVAVETRNDADRAKASSKMELREIPVQKVSSPSSGPVRMFMYGGAMMKSGSQPRAPQSKKRLSGRRLYKSRCASFASAQESMFDQDEEAEQTNTFSSELGHPTAEEQATASDQTPALNQLLALQQWDGSWTLSADLETVTKITVADINAVVSKIILTTNAAVLATVFAVTYIQDKFPDQANIWQAIVNKATTFLAKKAGADVIIALTASLLSLIQSH